MEGNLAYKEEPRFEVIGGKVVMMASPTVYHNDVKGSIYNIFYIIRGIYNTGCCFY